MLWNSVQYAAREEYLSKYVMILLQFFMNKELVKQALYMTSYLFEIGYVKGINCINGDVSRTDSYYGEISITPNGYDRIDQLQQRDNEGKDALVAMRF